MSMRGCNVEARDIILERYMKMKFLQKKWQKIIFWSIVGYLSFVLVV